MKYYLVLLFLCLTGPAFSQNLHADFYLGGSNYQGDLQPKAFTFERSGFAGGIGLSYDLSPRFILRSALNYATIQGNDKYNTAAKGVDIRNLNFRSRIMEGQIALEINLFNLTERSFTPYLYGGAAVFHFNPFTYDSTGAKAYLPPLSTEGQGLAAYPDRKPYKLTQFALPFGGGIKLALTDNLQVGLELGFRKLFTDHLDDVSTSYVDSATLASARGSRAVALAFRGDEVNPGATYPADGAQRGNYKLKDWYYITGLRISYQLGSGNRNSRKMKTGCPANIY